MSKILIVDDDTDMCMLLERFLSRKGFVVKTVHKGSLALEWLTTNKTDIILCDFRLEDYTGAELLPELKKLSNNAPVVIITGYSEVKAAVEVMKNGASDYITKPLVPDEILSTIQKALGNNRKGEPQAAKTENNNAGVNGRPPAATLSEYIESKSEVFENIIKQVNLVAPTNYSVIIYGESGSGKEAIAQQIHNKSSRANKPFVAIDCGALSKELAASELFGHEKGAFTGALFQKVGSFEVANGGTIFLDEIANLSYEIQVSLLRVVQERTIKRLGGTKEIPLDVRIIIASNEPLLQATKDGKFREDLYHRFNEFSIEVPPLRQRKEDIMFFARHFLALTNDELGKNVKDFSPDVKAIFNDYVWPGNLRELRNVIKRSTLLSDGDYIETKTLPFEIVNYKKLQFDDNEPAGEESPVAKPSDINRLKSANMDTEYEIILDVLKQTNYNKSKAAKMLNIDRKTLYNKLNQYKLLKSKT
ncbi:MAG TPA: sigma-54 dependent transcriptional regulator [Flavipsychrobacter sp.]